MPHCTTNFTWYLGKFIVGFAGMLFLYVGFLKENEYSCLCKPRMRELNRQKGGSGERRLDRCQCAEGLQRKVYGCGCKKQIRLNRFSISGCRTTTEHLAVKQVSTPSSPVAAPVGDYNRPDNAHVKMESIECESRPGSDGNSKLIESNINLQEEQSLANYECCCLRDGSAANNRRKRQSNLQKSCTNRRTSEIDTVPCVSNASDEYRTKISENTAAVTSEVEPERMEKAAQRSESALIGVRRRVKYRWHKTMETKRFVDRTTSSIVKDETPSTTYFDAVNSFIHDDHKRVESDSHIILGRYDDLRHRAAPAATLCTGCRAKKNVSISRPHAKSSKSDQRLPRHESARPEANLLYENTSCIKMKDRIVTKSESRLSADHRDYLPRRNYDSIDNNYFNDRTESCSGCGRQNNLVSRSYREKRTLKTGRKVYKSSSQSDVDSVGLRNEDFEDFLNEGHSGRTSDRYTSTTTTGVFSDAPANVAHKTKKYVRSARIASPLPSREDMQNYSSDRLHSGKYTLRQKISFSRTQPVRRDKLTRTSHDGIHKSSSHQSATLMSRRAASKCTCGKNTSSVPNVDQCSTSGSFIELQNMSEATLKQLLRARRRALALKSKPSENEISGTGAESICSISSSFVNSQTENSSQPARLRGCICCKRARRGHLYVAPQKTYKNTSSSTSSLTPSRRRLFSASSYNIAPPTNRTTRFDTSCTSTCSENVVGSSRLKSLKIKRTSSSSSAASARNMKKSSSNDSFLSALKNRIRKHDSSFGMRICRARKWNDGRRRSRRKRRKAGIIFEGRDEYDSHESMPCCIEYYEEVQNAMLLAHDSGRRLPVLEESDRTIDDPDEEQEDGQLEETSAMDTNGLSEDSWRRVHFLDKRYAQEWELNDRDGSSECNSEKWRRRSVGNRRVIVTVS